MPSEPRASADSSRPATLARQSPPPHRNDTDTHSRVTQAGRGSGRRTSRRRLQSSRSPRQWQTAGHGRCTASSESCLGAPWPPLPAGPARPSPAHSSSPSAAAAARSPGAPIAARPAASGSAPSSAVSRTPKSTDSQTGLDTPIAASCSWPFSPGTEGLACPCTVGEPAAEDRQPRYRQQERRPRARSHVEKLFRLRRAAGRVVPARQNGEAGRGGGRAPIGPPGTRGHVTITSLQPRAGAREKVELRL